MRSNDEPPTRSLLIVPRTRKKRLPALLFFTALATLVLFVATRPPKRPAYPRWDSHGRPAPPAPQKPDPDAALADLSRSDSPVRALGRINEASRHFEDALLTRINTTAATVHGRSSAGGSSTSPRSASGSNPSSMRPMPTFIGKPRFPSRRMADRVRRE
jgi:hypothetical protein